MDQTRQQQPPKVALYRSTPGKRDGWYDPAGHFALDPVTGRVLLTVEDEAPRSKLDQLATGIEPGSMGPTRIRVPLPKDLRRAV